MNSLFFLIMLVVAVVLQGLFEGYETGFVSANPIRIRFLADEGRSKHASTLLRYLEKPDAMLTTLLIGTNLAMVVATIGLSRQVARLVPDRYVDLVALAVASPIFLVCGQIIPKSIFRIHPNRLTLSFLPAIRIFSIIFWPVAVPITRVSSLLLNIWGGPERHLSPFMPSVDDVRVLVDEGADQGTIDRQEQEMIHSVIDLQNSLAKEIMVPRIDVIAVPESATRTELMGLFEETGKTRVPVFRDTIDEIIGVVNVYDLITDAEPERPDIGRFVKEVIHVPDTMRVDDLFKILREEKQHMAVVTDEYGGTDGIVTLEDILEEIFGEIRDEYDQEVSMLYKVGPRAFVIDGRMSLEDAAAALGVPMEDEDVETVAGWLMHIAGRIPLQGQVIEHGPFRATVLDGTVSQIAKVRLELAETINEDRQERKDNNDVS